MTYPMPLELLEQLELEPCADNDPAWLEDDDALRWGRPAVSEPPSRPDRQSRTLD